MDYQFFQFINKEKRIIGLTLDIFIPCVVFVIVIFLGLRSPVLCVASCIVWYGLMNYIKKGNPPSYLMIQAYWYLPGLKLKDKEGEIKNLSILGNIPPAEKVYWLG